MNGTPSRNATSRCRARRHMRRGAATVEFAMTAPFLFALLLGMVDVGQLANVGQAVSGASALGAREAAKPTTETADAVKSRVTGFLATRFPNLSDTTLASTVEVNVLDSAGSPLSAASLEAVESGSPVTVQVAFQFDSVRWLNGIGAGQGKTLYTTTVVRRE
jgi:Flp pilus assembly protein TadG